MLLPDVCIAWMRPRRVQRAHPAIGELDPVILDVLPGGEMAVAAVVAARDMASRRNCFDDSVP